MVRLHELGQAAGEGEGRTVFVTVEAGMGKSTMCEALLAQVQAGPANSHNKKNPRLQIARGDCPEQFGREEAFLPFAEALADLLRTQARDQTTARKLFNVVYDCAPAWTGVVPDVGAVLAVLMATAMAAREPLGSGEQAQFSQPAQSRMRQEYHNAP